LPASSQISSKQGANATVAMRVSHLDQDTLLMLDPEEADCLADACALLVCASVHLDDGSLHPRTAQVLSQVFTALARRGSTD
jgi:hypothetical protein